MNSEVKFIGPFSQKSALFHKNVPFLANIERYPKFLEYALHDLIYSKKSYICKWTEMTCWKGEVLGYNNSSSCRTNPYNIFMVAIAMELWKLYYLFYSIFQVSIYPGLFLSQQLQMVRQMFFTMPVVFLLSHDDREKVIKLTTTDIA